MRWIENDQKNFRGLDHIIYNLDFTGDSTGAGGRIAGQ
jgi:hypothetical protein